MTDRIRPTNDIGTQFSGTRLPPPERPRTVSALIGEISATFHIRVCALHDVPLLMISGEEMPFLCIGKQSPGHRMDIEHTSLRETNINRLSIGLRIGY